MLKLELITNDNLQLSLEVFHKVFTWMPGNVDPYSTSFEDDSKEYYLVYDEDKIIGITGVYVVLEDPESAWLGWFGVLPEKRGCHYGSKILDLYEEHIKNAGFKYSRLYTEANNNDATQHFYEKCGYVKEEYYSDKEPSFLKGIFVIYSKSLGEWPVTLWNNRCLQIYETEKGFYTKEQLDNVEELIRTTTAKPHS